tara:strand:+ start:1048 stop:1167 length:120 start_codon:yes stop_codon:yes gene_type:complete
MPAYVVVSCSAIVSDLWAIGGYVCAKENFYGRNCQFGTI